MLDSWEVRRQSVSNSAESVNDLVKQALAVDVDNDDVHVASIDCGPWA